MLAKSSLKEQHEHCKLNFVVQFACPNYLYFFRAQQIECDTLNADNSLSKNANSALALVC